MKALACLLLLLCACQRSAETKPAEPRPTPAAKPPPAAPRPAEPKALWHCPMHPNYTSERPGDCPICGMSLVPVPRAEAPAPQPAASAKEVEGFAPIQMSADWRRLLGLKTAVARRGPVTTPLRAVGRVTYDETRVHHVHTRYEAYIERLYADFVGKYVRRGQALASLYSPELYAAEQEYLLALRGRASTGDALVDAARQKLLLWNISGADIEQLERSGAAQQSLNLYAPTAGYIVAKTAYHGMRVKPEDSLFEIVDLSRVWVLCDVYEYELPRLRLGLQATVTLPYWPDRKWSGRLSYLYPSLDPKTRTLKARLEVDNSGGELRAEMFADVRIDTAPRSGLLVPEDAVLETGARRLVFLTLPDGRLQPREVRTGARQDDAAGHLLEITTGLKEGEQVAVGASFLLDSESRLQSVLSAMGAEKP